MNDDSELIDETRSGRSAAFGQLVQSYQDRLCSVVFHVVGNPEDARDVVQEAFVQAFLKLGTFRGDCQFYTWLCRIAFNLAASQSRHRAVVLSVERLHDDFRQEPMDVRARPEQEAERKERAGQVQMALAMLGERHRSMLVLREIEGFCYGTIAEILDLPIGTVRSRLHRARLELREMLEGMQVSAD